MVLESNRDLVVRRLLECLGRDRTKHQVAEVTSLGLVQMTRKRVGSGLIEVFSETCEHCGGRGIIVHDHPVEKSSGGGGGNGGGESGGSGQSGRGGRGRRGRSGAAGTSAEPVQPVQHGGPTPAQIAAAAHAAALKSVEHQFADELVAQDEPPLEVHEAGDQEAPEPVAVEPVAPEPAVEEPAVEEPVPAVQPAPAAEPAPRRRKRARVVAPAGPPRAASATSAEPSPEASSDAS
jgi:ribonuclease E